MISKIKNIYFQSLLICVAIISLNLYVPNNINLNIDLDSMYAVEFAFYIAYISILPVFTRFKEISVTDIKSMYDELLNNMVVGIKIFLLLQVILIFNKIIVLSNFNNIILFISAYLSILNLMYFIKILLKLGSDLKAYT